jgi:hypothetical protein
VGQLEGKGAREWARGVAQGRAQAGSKHAGMRGQQFVHAGWGVCASARVGGQGVLAGLHARAGEQLCGHYMHDVLGSMHDVLGCMHVGFPCNSPHAHTKTVPAFSVLFLFTPFI